MTRFTLVPPRFAPMLQRIEQTGRFVMPEPYTVTTRDVDTALRHGWAQRVADDGTVLPVIYDGDVLRLTSWSGTWQLTAEGRLGWRLRDLIGPHGTVTARGAHWLLTGEDYLQVTVASLFRSGLLQSYWHRPDLSHLGARVVALLQEFEVHP